MSKGRRIGFAAILVSMVAFALPALADGLVVGDGPPSMAAPVSGDQLSRVRGGKRAHAPVEPVRANTENAGLAGTPSSNVFPTASRPTVSRIGSEIAVARVHLRQIQADVSMTAR